MISTSALSRRRFPLSAFMPRKREFSLEAPSVHAMSVGRRERRPVERFVAGPSAAPADRGGDYDGLANAPDAAFADLLERAKDPPYVVLCAGCSALRSCVRTLCVLRALFALIRESQSPRYVHVHLAAGAPPGTRSRRCRTACRTWQGPWCCEWSIARCSRGTLARYERVARPPLSL